MQFLHSQESTDGPVDMCFAFQEHSHELSSTVIMVENSVC